ncbi:unnamed protein product [Didymodactylos carnosus]|uniref:EF-hand domain-containing protein n=1 Tax=Didymodactylos carnosus TaxID=1234261 RepID=A0A813SAH8_9BILA|nr:unnamed protein product [Didymodactylos carnosus]CAF3577924.1 unnamed protein product [Didymodactylos carnosus]
MGNKPAVQKTRATLTGQQIENLKQRTRMSEEEIIKWFDGFQKDCPDGLLTQKHFVQMYNRAFPEGDATKFAKRIFVTFDRDNSGKIDFDEFLLAMDLMEKGNLDEKLKYAFQLYDFNKDGILTHSEIENIIKMVLSLRGEGGNDQLKQEVMQHLDSFISRFDENKDMVISQEEFCNICSKDKYLREFLSPTFST